MNSGYPPNVTPIDSIDDLPNLEKFIREPYVEFNV